MKSRVHYFSLVTSERLNERYGFSFFVGPAARKVLGTARALSSVNAHPVIVSALMPSRRGNRLSSAERIGRTPYVRLFALGGGLIRRLTASLSFLGYTTSVVRRNDVVLLYNAYPEYILSAFYRWMIGRRVILDLEDGPRSDDRTIRGWVNSITFYIVRSLADRRIVTVSKALARSHNIGSYFINYGVSYQSHASNNNGARFTTDSPLSILYGGTISPETGSNIFCGAVRQLAANYPGVRVNFHVTGMFDPHFLECLPRQTESGQKVIVHGEISLDTYNALLNTVDVGLCLKLSSHSVGRATFPSKVIEISAAGALLCSTRVSDVPDIFSEETAVFLDNESADGLATAIVQISSNKEEMKRRAHLGQLMVEESFSEQKIGRDLKSFLFA